MFDRPTVIHSHNSKLLYSNVNLKCASHMTPFDSRTFPDCLAIASDDALLIGTIDEIQKLHVRTVPLRETPRRIAHLERAKSFAVLTNKVERSSCLCMRLPVHCDLCMIGLFNLPPMHGRRAYQIEMLGPPVLQSNDVEGTETSYVRLLDDQTFEHTHFHELKQNEVDDSRK